MKKRRKVQKITIVVILTMFLTSFNQFSLSGNQTIDIVRDFPSGWSEDYSLTNPDWCNDPDIVFSDNSIHMVYFNGSNGESYFRRSSDCGFTWNKNEMITGIDDVYSSWAAKIALNNTTIHVVWDDSKLQPPKREIFYRHSIDNGESWDLEFNISANDGYRSQNPSIACSGQNAHVVWMDERTGDFEVFYKMSNDSGITWQDGQGNVNQDRKLTFWPGTDEPVGIAVSGNHVHIFFVKITSGNVRRAYYLHSPDNGATWEPEKELSNDPLSAYADNIIAEGSNVYVLWTGFKDGNREKYFRRSLDNGTTWEPEIKLTNEPNWSDQADIAANSSHVFVTWMDDRDHYDWTGSTSGAFELYYKESFDGGSSWGNDTRLTYAVNNSIQPCVAMDANCIHVAWTDNRTDGSREQIFYKRYPDFPDTTPPSHTNEIPLPDSYKDAPGTNISVHVTDPSGVNASTIQLWVNGSLVPHVAAPIIDGYNVSWASGGFNSGVVTCRIAAEDNCSNQLDYTWNFTVLALYDISLQEGWNLISLPLEQVDTSIPSVLASIDGQYEVVKYYDTTDIMDHWKTYRPGASTHDLMDIDHTMGFWIKITEPGVNLTVKGIIPTSTTIPLYAGWNLVGYPTQMVQTVGNALWGTGADRIEKFDAMNPYFISEVGATYIMKPGEGYWIHVPADTVWTVNW